MPKCDSMMMMMMIYDDEFFCGMVDQRKAFSLISSRSHCQRSSPSRISDVLRAGSNLRRTRVLTWVNEVVQ